MADVVQKAAESEMCREHEYLGNEAQRDHQFTEKQAEWDHQFGESEARRGVTLTQQPVPSGAPAPLPEDMFGLPPEVLVLLRISLVQVLHFLCEEQSLTEAKVLEEKEADKACKSPQLHQHGDDTQKTQRQPRELVIILQENNVNRLPARL
jgi:hypothetical protein